MGLNRLTPEEFQKRAQQMYNQFKAGLQGMSFEDFYKEALEEYQKQQSMSDDELKNYRIKSYNELCNDLEKTMTPEQKKKLAEADLKTVTPIDEIKENDNKSKIL